MQRWLVTQDNGQFAVDGLEELRELARSGKLRPGDMVQPPGATDWLYASEIPELKGLMKEDHGDDDDLEFGRRGGGTAAKIAIAALLGGVLLAGGGGMAFFYQRLADDPGRLIGEGSALSFSEMLVTQEAAPLLADPDAAGSSKMALEKDSVVELHAKRGDFYRIKTQSGAEGWVNVLHVLPMYQLGDSKVRDEYDPLYNPDQYVHVMNASWLQLDEKNIQLTVFNFMLHNKSRYPITDLKLLATVKDAKGNEIERVEIPVEGEIPAWDSTMVGTLEPDKKAAKDGAEKRLLTNYTFAKLSEDDPDLMLQWKEGVEVEMTAKDFTAAEIDLLELRAIPEAQPKPKRR
jgi:hypothetical protein